MKLRKYPVTAPSGREYDVEVVRRYGGLGNMSLRFKIFKRESYVGWFGRVRERRVLLKNDSYWEFDIDDVIKKIEELVVRIERETVKDLRRWDSYARFAEWDGRITE